MPVTYGSVSPRRVVEVQSDTVIISTSALGEDENIVSVQVNGVVDGQRGIDNEVHPLVGSGEFNNGIVILEVRLLVYDHLQGRVGPVDEHAGAVERPLEEVVDYRERRLCVVIPVRAADGLGKVRHQVRLVDALVGLVLPLASGRFRCRVRVRHDRAHIVCIRDGGACRLWDRAHPEVVRYVGLVGCHDDIVALTYYLGIVS